MRRNFFRLLQISLDIRFHSGVAGVTAVTVSLEDKQAVVEGSATDEALTAAIVDAGYEVKGIE